MMRPANSVMMAFAVMVGEVITLRGELRPIPTLLGVVTAFTLTASSMVINDYFDREVDRVNEPQRPLPSGAITPTGALLCAAVLGVLGLFSAYLTTPPTLLALSVATFAYGLAVFYNAEGKRWGLAGNLMVSGVVAVPFLYGSFIVGVVPGELLLLFASLAFLSNTGREIIKGISDVEGDKLRGVKTLALTLGGRGASLTASAFYLGAVAASLIPFFRGGVSLFYFPLVGVADLGFLYSSVSIMKTPTRENTKRVKKLSLIWMFSGLLAFLLGGL